MASFTIINGSYSGDVVAVTADEVLIEKLTIIGSGSGNSGILLSEGDSVLDLRFADSHVILFRRRFQQVIFKQYPR